MTLTERVLYMQHGDQQIREMIEIMKNNATERSKHERGLVEGFKLGDGILYRTVRDKDLFVAPKTMRKGLTIAAHDLAGHFGVDRTITRLQKDFWFANIRRYVKQHINMCIDCLVNKKPGGRRPGYLHPIPPGTRPFAIIHKCWTI